MKKTIRFISMVVVLLMLVAVFAGCSSEGPVATESSSAAPSVSTSTSETAQASASTSDTANAGTETQKQYTIALSLKTITNNDFQKVLADSFKKYVEASGNKFQLVLAGEELAVSAQVNQIEDLIAQKVDCIVVNPMDSKAVIPALKKAKEAGIPVFIIDAMIEAGNDDLFVTFVGTDNYQAGMQAGKKMIELLGGKGNVILVRGANGSKSGDDRMDGFKKALEGSEVKVVAEQPGDWTNDKAMTVTENMLQGNAQVDGLFCASDGMLDGILSAINDNDRTGIKIISVDGTKKSVDYIKNGDIVGTIAQFPDKICQMTVDDIVKYLNGTLGDIPKQNDSGTIFLDKSNPQDADKYSF
jgi:ribose transport system substrate-binding protein